MFVRKSLFAIAASLMTMAAFSLTVAVMTIDGGTGFPAAPIGNHQLA